MSTKRVMCFVLVASAVMLAAGAVPGSAARSPSIDLGSPFATAEGLGAEMRLSSSPESGSGLAAAGGGPIGSLFLIADQPVDTWDPAVAYNSQRQESLVVWWNARAACRDIYGQRVSKDGTLAGPWFAIAAGCPEERLYPRVAYNSQQDEYLVVWEQRPTVSSSGDIYGQRVSATGGLLGGAIGIAVGAPGSSRYDPLVAYASTEDKYLVVFGYYYPPTGGGIAARALQSDGSPWGSAFDIQPPSGTGFYPYGELAYNRLRNELLVVSIQYNPTAPDIRGQRVKMSGGAGTLGSAFWISTDPAGEFSPVVAAVPRPPDGQYLVVWAKRFSSGDDDIWAQRVAGVGTLEGGPISISTSPVDEGAPAVAGKDSNQTYLVAWTRGLPYGEMLGVAVSSDGTPGGEFRLGGPDISSRSVSSGPLGDFLIAFDNLPSGASSRDIYGRLWGNRVYLPLVVR